MPFSKRFRHILAGFCMGMGFIIIVFAFLIWAFTNTLVDAFNSWAEQHGYTLAQSGLVATYQLPLIFTLIVVLGLIVLILGVIVVMIAKDEAQIPPSPPVAPPSELREGGNWHCPKCKICICASCALRMKNYAVKCPKCGNEIRD